MENSKSLIINLEFRGGAELLFNKMSKHQIQLPIRDRPWTIYSLLIWLKNNLLTERPELFLRENTVRPGILVLVNDTDWEILGQINYELKQNDTVMFLSTLHGG